MPHVQRRLPCAAVVCLLATGFARIAFAAEEAPSLRCAASPGGYVTTWLVAGPFDPDAPLAIPDSAPAEGGRTGGSSWAMLVSDGRFRESALSTRITPGVMLTSMLGPRRSGAFLAAAVVESKAGGRRRIEAGSLGAIDVWVNSTRAMKLPADEYAWLAEDSAEVELKPGRNLVVCAVRGRYGVAGFYLKLAPGADDRVILPCAAATAAAPEQPLLDSLLFAVRPEAAGEGTAPVVLCLIGGSVECPSAGLSARIRADAGGGRPGAALDLGLLDPAKLRDEPFFGKVELPDAPSPSVDMVAELIREGRVVASKRQRLVRPERLLPGIDGMEKAVFETEKKLGRRLPVAQLALDKARLYLGSAARAGLSTDAAFEEYTRCEAALKAAREGKDSPPKSGFAELAYFSEIENSPQPYLVYIPTIHAKEPARKLPLVIYLHGYVPSYDKHSWLWEDPDMNAVMEAEDCLLALPFARSNTDFLTAGEVDVLEVVREMKRQYPVDESRVYLYGYSMGGSGVWTLATHYPDIFAAACVIAGRTNYYLWFDLKREGVPAWTRTLIEADNPIDQVVNLGHTPVLVYHGTEDTVVQKEHATDMVRAMTALGYTAEMRWIEGGNHWSGFDAVLAKREPVQWMKRFTRPDFPESVSLKTMTPRYGRSFWIEVTELRRWGEFAEINAAIKDGKLTVEAKNVAKFWLISFRESLAKEKVFKALDGGEYESFGESGEAGIVTYECRLKREAAPKGLAKTALRPGPVKEAFNAPFTITYGTKGSQVETLVLRSSAEAWQETWFRFAKSRPPLCADSDVTDDLMESRNVVCFGTPQTHAVLARAADKLPIKFPAKDKVELGGTTYSLENRGLLFCYPNPLAKSEARYLIVSAGLGWGERLSINHKLDFVPDFILFGEEPEVPEADWPRGFWVPEFYKSGRAVVAGFFDSRWAFSEKFTARAKE